MGSLQANGSPLSLFLLGVLLACPMPEIGAADISLSHARLRERLPIGSVVGMLADADSANAVFSFATGTGDDDNGRFTIDGRLLRSAAVLAKVDLATASILVQSSGSGGSGTRSISIAIDPITPGWVMGWGSQFTYGDTPVWEPPESLGQVVEICAGYGDVYAIRTDGAIVHWGPPSTSFDVVKSPSDWVALSANFGNAMALRIDGTVEALAGTAPPVGLANVIAIASGQRFSLALKSDGTVVAWGDVSAEPAVLSVPGTLGQVVAIAAGNSFALALRSDGTIAGWGTDNIQQASGGNALTGVVGISAGDEFGHALLVDGTVHGWGNSSYDRTAVPVGISGCVAIESGQSTTLALKSDGTVVAWGVSVWELGQIDVPPELRQVVAISSGRSPTLAIHTLGRRPSAPTIDLHPTMEAQPAGIDAATLSATDPDGDGISFTLVSADGAPLAIGGASNHHIVTTGPLDYEAIRSHRIRVRATDASGLYREGDAVVEVIPTSEWPPESLSLIPAMIPTMASAGQRIGTLRAADRDAGEVFTYQLLDDDGGRFVLADDTIVAAAGGFAAGDVHSITAVVTDSGGATLSKTFSLPVGFAGPPSGPVNGGVLALSGTNVGERLPPGTLVGHISDLVASGVPTFTLVDGPGDDDNGLFSVDGTLLRTTAVLVTAANPSLRIRLRSIDGPAQREDVFVVSVVPRRSGEAMAWGGSGTASFSGIGLVRLVSMSYTTGSAIRSHDAATDDVTAIDSYFITSAQLHEDGSVTGTPTPPAGLDRVIAIACGMYHVLALRDDGSIVAWGDVGAKRGCLQIPPGLQDAIAIGAGRDVSWAVKSDGTIIGWGVDTINQVSGTTAISGSVSVAGSEENATALLSDGSVAVWGNASFGRANVPPGLNGVVALDGGAAHTLALRSDGSVAAWGVNSEGQCTVPTTLNSAIAVSAGRFASVAIHRKAFRRTMTITITETSGPASGVRVAGGDEYAEAYTDVLGNAPFTGLSPLVEQAFGFADPADDVPASPLAPQ